MRLYNAASCTPCCSTLPKPAPSFVPMVAASEVVDCDEDNEYERQLQKGDLDEIKRPALEPSKNTEKFRYLAKIPSTTTSTTGGETPPFDNTTHSLPHSGGKEECIINRDREISGLDFRQPGHSRPAAPQTCLAWKSMLQQRRPKPTTNVGGCRLVSKNHIIEPIASTCSEDKKDNDHDFHFDLDPEDVESSCSTLTTTRSMILQEEHQEDLAITLSSHRKEKGNPTESVRSSRLPSTQISILNIDTSAREIPVQRTGNISRGLFDTEPHKGNSNPNEQKDPWPPLSPASGETNHIESQQNCCSQVGPAIKTKEEDIKISKNFTAESFHPHNAPSQMRGDDDYAMVKAKLRKVATNAPRTERIDFFPMQTQTPSNKNIGNPGATPRLGASSRFPSLRGHQAEDHEKEPGEESWDPFNDDRDGQKINEVTETPWVHFDGEKDTQSPKDWIDSEWLEAESPVAFPTRERQEYPSDSPVTCLLDDHYLGGRKDSSQSNKENRYQVPESFSWDTKQEPRQHQDIQKQGDGGKSRNRDFFQKPKLLGPLLEKRFTRSYWRRLKGNKRQSRNIKSLNVNEGSEGQTAFGHEAEETKEPSTFTSQRKTDQVHKPQFLSEDWWDTPFDDNGDFTDDLENASGIAKRPAVSRAGNSDENSTLELADAKILGSQRINDCQTIMDSLGLAPDHLIHVIDTTDASTPLTKDQITNLYRLLPTAKERRLLMNHLKESRRRSSLHGISNKVELFMLHLIGVEKVQQKLESLSFQNEFPGLMQRLSQECRLLQTCCEEILQSSRVEKVLGITNMLENRLVGKTPGKRKTNMISLGSLMEMMEESQSEQESNQPFLVYACARIQKTKPALLKFKDELPSLSNAIGQTDWDVLCLELEALEARFETFREFALLVSAAESNARQMRSSTMSVEQEIDVLQSTSIGAFAVDACLRMAELYEVFDGTQNGYDGLVQSFVDEKDEKPSLSTILATFASFGSYVERFN